jgi:hypothetical protein
MLGASLSLEHALLQLGHFPSVAMHLRIHIEQNVCEQDVMTGFERNSLHTSQRKAASSDSNAGRDVFNQSVESGRSNVESMGQLSGSVGWIGVLVPCDDGGMILAKVASTRRSISWSRAIFELTRALSASNGRPFRGSDTKASCDCSVMKYERWNAGRYFGWIGISTAVERVTELIWYGHANMQSLFHSILVLLGIHW